MNRRRFLSSAAAGAAAMTALSGSVFGQGQTPATTTPTQGRGGQAGGGRGAGSPANVPAAKLARVSLMTLNFRTMLKFPWTQNPNENQTLDVFDLPKMYQDVYGVSHIEFQHDHLVNGEQTPPDAAFFREMRAKLDAAKVTATQVNIEIGEIPNLAGEAREKWMTLGKQWVDAAPIIGVTRLMLNQTGLNEENKANCTSVWKEIQDYAKPKGIKISAETRGTGGGRGGAQAGGQPPAAPPDPRAAATSGISPSEAGHRSSRRLLQHRYRERRRTGPADAARRHQGPLPDLVGQHAHQVEPQLGHRRGRAVHRVAGISRAVLDRSERPSCGQAGLRHHSGERDEPARVEMRSRPMNRRDFLTAAAAAGMAATGLAQAPAQPPAQGRQGGGRGGRGRGGPANVSPEKLARVEIMTLNHSNIIKLPGRRRRRSARSISLTCRSTTSTCTASGTSSSRATTSRRTTTNRTCAYIRELRAKLDAAGAKAHQINIEIGVMAQMGPDGKAAALSGDARAAWLERAKKWVDLSPVLGVTRLMHNQGALTDDSKAGVTSLWKELQDYATPKGIKISGETRGAAPDPGQRRPGGRARDGAGHARAGAAPLRVGHPLGMHQRQRRLHQPRLRRRDPLPQPAGAARCHQGPAPAQRRRHAHASQSDVGSGYGDQVRRVARLQGHVHHRGERGSGGADHLQRDPR